MLTTLARTKQRKQDDVFSALVAVNALSVRDGLNVRRLSALTGHAEPRISETVRDMEAAGIVRRTRAGKDLIITLAKHPASFY